jgi:diphthamide biosynthesis enzyme Dph1/Dph2-like protein
MKTLFFPVKSKETMNSSELEKISRVLPKNLAIVYSVQYQDFAESLRKNISKSHKILDFFQILGCSNPKFSEKIEGILLISDGDFHAISLACETKKTVYLLEKNRLIKILPERVNFLEKKRKAAYVNFLNSSKIGVLISTKPGQQRLSRALNLKEKFKDKKLYFFISNNIDLKEIENFGLDSWINTACPRMDMESSKIINLNRIFEN